jgi:hypothetical protein
MDEALSRIVYREVHGMLGKFAKDVEEEGKRLARKNGSTWCLKKNTRCNRNASEGGNDPIVFEITQGRRDIFFQQLFLFISQRQINISRSQARNVIGAHLRQS